MTGMEDNGADRFDELLDAVLDGAADEAQAAAFNLLLERDPERREAYLRQVRMHVLLGACPALRENGGRKTGDGRRRLSVGWRVAAAAAAFLAGLAVWRMSRPASPVSEAALVQKVLSPVMTVRASRHGQWADGREVTAGTVLPAGVWEWQSGLVELVTCDGTVLLVEAPAALEMVNPLYARLISGNVVVRMPKGRSGFVVETREMKVFDLGTEFGVSALSGGESQVQVFDGKVRAETADCAMRWELRAGDTAKATTGGGLISETYDEKRFIRRFPPVVNPERPSGVLYSRSRVETVRVARAAHPIAVDGDLAEWNRQTAFKSTCDAPYAETYWLEGMMMYDAANLYLAAHVGDPDPMRNTAPEGFEFAGGSVIVRVSTDKTQGWPLKGSLFDGGVYDFGRSRVSKEARSERITSVVLWYDAQAGCARLKLERGIDLHDQRIDPPGWRGVFRKDADGCGYTLEYAIPWRLFNCADDPPRSGDALAVLWMSHWSDADGRIARGQLVEVTNRHVRRQEGIAPYNFFQNGPNWGRAEYQ